MLTIAGALRMYMLQKFRVSNKAVYKLKRKVFCSVTLGSFAASVYALGKELHAPSKFHCMCSKCTVHAVVAVKPIMYCPSKDFRSTWI